MYYRDHVPAEDRTAGVISVLPRITDARYTKDHRVWIRFSDGADGEIDLGQELIGPIFEPLRNLETFRSFRLDPELHTLVWPNGADFAPEFLRARLSSRATVS
jgi:hypothetical protein